jgi:nicotinamide-nucleotide amidase
MQAAVLAVGNELLGSDRIDSNSLYLAGVLARAGVPLATKVVVGDDIALIAEAASRLADRYDLLLVTGGLGPTQDDLTREAMAAVVGRGLVRDRAVLDDLRRKFEAFGIDMPPVNEKQADVIEGAEVLMNRRGTAPGMRVRHGSCTVFLFPGVPTELEGLAESALDPWLAENASGSGLERVVFKVACVPESTLEQKLQAFYEEWGEEGVALLPSAGEVSVRLSIDGRPDERERWLQPRRRALRGLLATSLFGESEEATLESAAGKALASAGLSVATAESCTGGLVAERLTRVPGSSRYFLGSIVSYANEVKLGLLNVPRDLLETHGAVSREVAQSMARGVLRALGSDLSIAVTGIAGPEGGSREKPVGTVHIALCHSGQDNIVHRGLRLPGDRDRVRWVSSQWALEMLRRQALAG